MPHYIIKLGDLFCEWSTIVDAPISFMMTEFELHQYIQQRYGDEGLRSLPEQMASVAEQGTSCVYPLTPKQCIAGNRAGDGESEISEADILVRYMRPNPRGLPAREAGSASTELMGGEGQ